MSKEAQKPVCVLIVDDEPDFRDLLAEIIRRQGFEAVVASHGPEALELVRKKKIDLALIDYTMPHMDGIQLILEIAKLDPGVKNVLLTGNSIVADEISTNLTGKFEVLIKPVQFDRLEQLLKKLSG